MGGKGVGLVKSLCLKNIFGLHENGEAVNGTFHCVNEGYFCMNEKCNVF